MSEKSDQKKMFVHFKLSARAVKRLDEMVVVTDSASRTETVRHALQWYFWLVRLNEEDCKFYVKSKEGEIKEIAFLGNSGSL